MGQYTITNVYVSARLKKKCYLNPKIVFTSYVFLVKCNLMLFFFKSLGTAIPCTHIGCSGVVPSPGVHITSNKRTTNGVSNKMNKKLYNQTKNFTECPPSYEEAIRLQSNQISQ